MKEIIERIKALKELYPEKIDLQYGKLLKQSKGVSYDQSLKMDYVGIAENTLAIKIDDQLKQIYEFSESLRLASYYTFGMIPEKRKTISSFVDENFTIREFGQSKEKDYSFIAFMGCVGGGPNYGYFDNLDGTIHQVAIKKNPMEYDYELESEYTIIAPSIYDFFKILLDKIEPQIHALEKNDTYVYMPEWED